MNHYLRRMVPRFKKRTPGIERHLCSTCVPELLERGRMENAPESVIAFRCCGRLTRFDERDTDSLRCDGFRHQARQHDHGDDVRHHLDQRAGDAAHDRQVHAFNLNLDGGEEAEHQAAEEGVDGAPVAEHHGRQGQVAGAGRHVAQEEAALHDGQIRARERAQDAGHQHGQVARRFHAHAGRVGRMRVFAAGAQAQAEARVVQQPVHERDQEEGHVDEDGMAADQVGIHPADEGDVFHVLRARQDHVEQPRRPQVRRAAALLEEELRQHKRQPAHGDVDGHAGHQLVALLRDADIGLQQGQGDADEHAGRHAVIRVLRRVGHGGGSEGAGQDLAFQADVDHAAAFGKQAGHGGKDQDGRIAHGRYQDAGEMKVVECHGVSLWCA